MDNIAMTRSSIPSLMLAMRISSQQQRAHGTLFSKIRGWKQVFLQLDLWPPCTRGFITKSAHAYRRRGMACHVLAWAFLTTNCYTWLTSSFNILVLSYLSKWIDIGSFHLFIVHNSLYSHEYSYLNCFRCRWHSQYFNVLKFVKALVNCNSFLLFLSSCLRSAPRRLGCV